jgi:hypothetical protein
MLLLIDIFSINKGRGYENPSLEIIVTECYSIGGFPLEEAYEHFFLNQSAIFVVVLISFLCYCGDYARYITIIMPLLAFYFYFAYLLYLVSCNKTLWHHRLGHMSEKGMHILHKRNLFPYLKQIDLDFYEHYVYGKHKTVRFLRVRK